MKMQTHALPLLLCLLPVLPAQAAGTDPRLASELDEARAEVRVELDQARQALKTDNLRVDESLRFGDRHAGSADVPPAEITPQGDFRIDGEEVAINPSQRNALLAYRGQVIEIGMAGIDIGERSARVALEAVDTSMAALLFNAMSGRLERRIEKAVREDVEPAVAALCDKLPAVMASQQALALSLPAFQPYATLDADDIDACHRGAHDAFAAR